jgi:hypothetical protein
MQVIRGTFGSYAGPYAGTGPFMYGVSTDPEANIYAGLNYAEHAYPSLQYAMDKPGGYDNGGPLKPGWTAAYNGTGRPENVRTGQQEDALEKRLGRIEDKLGAVTQHFHINTTVSDPHVAAKVMAAQVDWQMRRSG